MDLSDVCERCEEVHGHNEKYCKMCSYGNPCIGCEDYSQIDDKCISNGGCAGNKQEVDK